MWNKPNIYSQDCEFGIANCEFLNSKSEIRNPKSEIAKKVVAPRPTGANNPFIATHEPCTNKAQGGHGRLLIISGPSGSGKTSICGELGKDPRVRKSISVTTRPPRPQEQEGRDYYFVSGEEFKKRIDRGEFVEYASYSGHLYGTPLKPLKKAMEEGVIYLLEIDVQGAQQVLKKFPEAISIFILPPHEEELAARIKGRNLQPDLQGRLAIAREEIKLANQYKYKVINDVLERAVEEIRHILELDSSKK